MRSGKCEAALKKSLCGLGIGLLTGQQAARLEYISTTRKGVTVTKLRCLIKEAIGFEEIVLVALRDSEERETRDREIGLIWRRLVFFYELKDFVV